MSAEQNLAVQFVGRLALREKQSQQNYRPYIGVHKWFARRPGALFRALLLAEFVHKPLVRTFFESNDLTGKRVGDIFLGGGTPLVEANRLGCDVFGYDINAMACWIVDEEIRDIDLDAYRRATVRVEQRLRKAVAGAYVTTCSVCGAHPVPVKSFLWVKIQQCSQCGKRIDLFPMYKIADAWRNQCNVIVCSLCGELNHVVNAQQLGACASCNARLRLQGPARDHECDCPHCGAANAYPKGREQPYDHRLFAMEYYCVRCRPQGGRRHFKKADARDLAIYKAASLHWNHMKPRFVPDDRIPAGQETERLFRFGYGRYCELFNSRQLASLETLARIIDGETDQRIRSALCTNFSDLLRYQNMLCRYDTKAVKVSDIFAIHGFPVGMIQCECNVIGIRTKGTQQLIGSGGWLNITDKYTRAKQYCAKPFEVIRHAGRTTKVYLCERIGMAGNNTSGRRSRRVLLRRCNSSSARLPRGLDAILTDPPYFGYVQYGELMEFCSAWLARLDPGFGARRHAYQRQIATDLSGQRGSKSGIVHYAAGLSAAFCRSAAALKVRGLFAFTYHHGNVAAYAALGAALMNAGLRCTFAFPCPSEMQGSFHIHGQRSPRLDMVFVCRKHSARMKSYDPNLARAQKEYTSAVRSMGITLTAADKGCILQGLVLCKAAAGLKGRWHSTWPIAKAVQVMELEMAKLIRGKGNTS